MRFIFLSLLILLISCSEKKESNKYDLRLNLEEGRTYQLSSTFDLAMDQDVEGQMLYSRINFNCKVSFTVISKNESSYDMKLRFEDLDIKVHSPLSNLNFDSEDPDTSDAISTALSIMIQHDLKIEMDFKGRVIAVQNVQELLNAATNSFPEMDSSKREEVISSLKEAYLQEAFIGNTEITTFLFPKQKIGVGSTWNNNIELKSLLSATISNSLKLVSHSSEFIVIHGESQITTKDIEMHKKLNGFNVSYELAGEMVSEIKLDTKTGWILSGNIEQTLAGDLKLKGNPGMPEGMTLPSTWHGRMTISGQLPE